MKTSNLIAIIILILVLVFGSISLIKYFEYKKVQTTYKEKYNRIYEERTNDLRGY